MNQFLWIGSYVPDALLEKVKRIGYYNPASILSQNNLIDGIEMESGRVFDTIGGLSMTGYPVQGNLFIKEERFSHRKNANDILVRFFNLIYLNKLTCKRSVKKETRIWARNHKNDEVHVFVYEMRSACLSAAVELKRVIPRAQIHLIVPDLPQFMDLRMNRLKKILKSIDWKQIKRCMKCVDNYILYSAQMADFLQIHDKHWMLMEGSVNSGEIESREIAGNDSNRHIVMYSGSIQQGFRIENLLKAFEYLDDDYELWITGGGSAEALVRKYSENDQRIKFFGYLASREELRKLQNSASMFVNMRDPDEPASTYCFPSKLFEYMLMGKPVLSVKLKGIPEEYYDYIVGMESIDPRDIADAIRETALDPHRTEMGMRAREFIIREKTNISQAKKILKFLRIEE